MDKQFLHGSMLAGYKESYTKTAGQRPRYPAVFLI